MYNVSVILIILDIVLKQFMKQISLVLLFSAELVFPQKGLQIARLKYNGGGDWYNDRSAEINLLRYASEHAGISTMPEYTFVEIGSAEMFSYPILFLTGHGTVKFSDSEAKALRSYLEKGGFLYADDDYGLDKSFRREIKKVFPEKELMELPFDHELYHILYDFNNGPPKIHEHDKKPPRGYGIFIGDRLAVYYTYESNPSDGWADPQVHNDSPALRELALKFGTNLLLYMLTN